MKRHWRAVRPKSILKPSASECYRNVTQLTFEVVYWLDGGKKYVFQAIAPLKFSGLLEGAILAACLAREISDGCTRIVETDL